MIRNIARMQTFASAKSRVENILDILEDLNDDFVFREGAMPEVIDAVASLVGSDDCVGQAWQLLFESRIAGHSGLLSFSTVLFAGLACCRGSRLGIASVFYRSIIDEKLGNST